MACSTWTGSGGALLGTSLMLQVFRSRQAPGSSPRNLGPLSCNPATVSLARARPAPVDQRCSTYSQTKPSICSRFLGRDKELSWRNERKPSTALVYLALVLGCTVRSFNWPNRCLCFTRSATVVPSKIRLGIAKFGTDLPPPPARFVGGVQVRMHVAP